MAGRAAADQNQFIAKITQCRSNDFQALHIGVARNHRRSSKRRRASVRSRTLPARSASNKARYS